MAVRKKFSLGLPYQAYSRAGLKNIKLEELQHEYARLRREANDRLRGFARSAVYRDSKVFADKAGMYIPIKAVKSRAELETLVIDAARFVTMKSSSVSGMKEIDRNRVESLQAAGYDFIRMGNIRHFGNFMEWMRANAYDRIYGSEKIASLYEYVERGRIPPEELKEMFNKYLELNKIEEAVRKRGKKIRRGEGETADLGY